MQFANWFSEICPAVRILLVPRKEFCFSVCSTAICKVQRQSEQFANHVQALQQTAAAFQQSATTRQIVELKVSSEFWLLQVLHSEIC